MTNIVIKYCHFNSSFITIFKSAAKYEGCSGKTETAGKNTGKKIYYSTDSRRRYTNNTILAFKDVTEQSVAVFLEHSSYFRKCTYFVADLV